MKKVLGTIIDILIFPLFFWRLFPRPSPPQRFRKILIMELWGIGDVVMMSSALKPLHSAFPNAEIAVLCQVHAREILKENKEVSRFFIFTFPWTRFHGKYLFWRWDWIRLLRMIMALRSEEFDLILDGRGDVRNNLLSFLIAGKRRVGLNQGNGVLLLTDAVPYSSICKHRVEQWRNLLSCIGVPCEDIHPSMNISNQERSKALKFLSDKFHALPKILVGVHPGAAQKVRCWPMSCFQELASRLMGQGDIDVLVFVEPEGYGHEIADELRLPNFQGCVRDLAALIAQLDVLVCNDTGVMHIATAVGTPVVAVFGPGDPEYIGPYGEGIVVMNECTHRPCFDNCQRESVDCLEKVTVEDVWNAAFCRSWVRKGGRDDQNLRCSD